MRKQKNLKVLAENYTLGDNPKVAQSLGTCCEHMNEIDIDPHLTDLRWLTTLFHEAGHAVYYEMDVGLKPDQEEIVTKMSTGFLTVLRHNPWLRKMISDLY